ncbi:hypothetical protein ZEAMMB73_Zm00001d025855 [Zea mays]|uniref:Uncharacterized protein n=1 Tax=Zea mays TaxID=4577 RepID=A0A1D6JAF3_MAIZE|nr:hypothetical protein ZEAMMB73_Zm00001d025855 [Zea mays]
MFCLRTLRSPAASDSPDPASPAISAAAPATSITPARDIPPRTPSIRSGPSPNVVCFFVCSSSQPTRLQQCGRGRLAGGGRRRRHLQRLQAGIRRS